MQDRFPVYLKLSNEKSFYIISSESQLIEYQRLGSKWLRHEVEAKILPERLLIHDLLDANNESVERITISEFQAATGVDLEKGD